MRRKIVAGNWKMNNTLQEADRLVAEVISLLEEDAPDDVTII